MNLKGLVTILLILLDTTLKASDTLIFKSLNGRYDCKIICDTKKESYSDDFLNLLSTTKLGSLYILKDSVIIIDNKDTIFLPKFNLQQQGNYVSAQKCFHQRNYSLVFTKQSVDSYFATLTILTDMRISSTMNFVLILQPFQLLTKGNVQFKVRKGNLKITANTPLSIIMENLFIENDPCPRAILFPK